MNLIQNQKYDENHENGERASTSIGLQNCCLSCAQQEAADK